MLRNRLESSASWFASEYSSFLFSPLVNSFDNVLGISATITSGDTSATVTAASGIFRPGDIGRTIELTSLPPGRITAVTDTTATISFERSLPTIQSTGGFAARIRMDNQGGISRVFGSTGVSSIRLKVPADLFRESIVGKTILTSLGGIFRVITRISSAEVDCRIVKLPDDVTWNLPAGWTSLVNLNNARRDNFSAINFHDRFSVMEDSWSGMRWPKVLGFHQDRFIMANTDSEPNRIWFSGIGDYFNFVAPEEFDTSSPFSLTFSPDAKIQWVLSEDFLFVGTNEGIYLLSHDGAFCFDNLTQKKISELGTVNHRPVSIGPEIFFIGVDRTNVYSLFFNREYNSYLTRNVIDKTKYNFDDPGSQVRITDLSSKDDDLIALSKLVLSNGDEIPGPLLYGSNNFERRVIGWSEWPSIYTAPGDFDPLTSQESNTTSFGAYIAAVYMEGLGTMYLTKQYGGNLVLEEYSEFAYFDLETSLAFGTSNTLIFPGGFLTATSLATHPDKVYLSRGGAAVDVKDHLTGSIPTASLATIPGNTNPVIGLDIAWRCTLFEPQISIAGSFLQGSPKTFSIIKVLTNQSSTPIYQSGLLPDGTMNVSSDRRIRNVLTGANTTYEVLRVRTQYNIFNNSTTLNSIGQIVLTSSNQESNIQYGPLEITAVFYNMVVHEE